MSPTGLVPVMRLAEDAGLHALADQWIKIPTDKGANVGLKVGALVAGMVAGADSIDDMAVLRHGGMKKAFSGCYAPRRSARSCVPSPSGTCASLMPLRPDSWSTSTEGTLARDPSGKDFVFVDVDDNRGLDMGGFTEVIRSN